MKLVQGGAANDVTGSFKQFGNHQEQEQGAGIWIGFRVMK
jgi:hypothetical protein